MSKVYHQNSYMGQKLIDMGSRYIGDSLREIYSTWSTRKESAYNECRKKYLDTPNHSNFAICSKSGWTFTVSWRGKYGDTDALFIETKSNSYVVLLDGKMAVARV